jgi:phenylpropionate dioxygenase-like ring-hydroxylating dioxygenase large terminal subunit
MQCLDFGVAALKIKTGARVDNSPYLSELDFTRFKMRVSTARYCSPEHHARERERLWMRTWQVAARVDELPNTGDWKTYAIFDQSFLLVRGKDDQIRGFVNACRHRGNALCQGDGNSKRFVCPYHLWSYSLEGDLLAIPRPDFKGSIEEFVGCKDELGLKQVPVESFGGFIFLNPDCNAAGLAEFLGEGSELLGPYHLDEMVPVGLNVQESVECNWKVIMDAFQEGYHIQGVHPELLRVADESKERYRFFRDHSVATAPFGSSNIDGLCAEKQLEAIRYLPATFPAVAEALPRFEALVDAYRNDQGLINFPADVSGRTLLQRATRATWTAKGLDVSELTDTQMSDNQFYLLFPNLFITIRAGEATVIVSAPHSDGNPNRCIWHVISLQWLPLNQRSTQRAPMLTIKKPDHFPYSLALEQDYAQMERQQKGLRQTALEYMLLTKQEVRLAHYHSVLDRWTE